jgi:hypothetical protein
MFNDINAMVLLDIEVKGLLEEEKNLIAGRGIVQQQISHVVRNLDLQHELRLKTLMLMKSVRDYLYPFLALRHYETVLALRQERTYQELRNLLQEMHEGKLDADFYQLAKSFHFVFSSIVNRLPWDNLSANYEKRVVAIGIGLPKDGVLNKTSWRKLPQDMLQKVWNDVFTRQQKVSITLRPADLYSPTSANYVLFCEESVPVIRHLGLIAVSGENFSDEHTVRISAADEQLFMHPVAKELRYYISREAAGLKRLSSRLIVGRAADAIRYFKESTKTDENVVGLSPFSTLTLDLSGVLDNVDPSQFSELVLVMELEYKKEPQAMSWISGCH